MVRDGDVLIVLFHTKVGQFTKEEFDTAYRNFKTGLNPRHIFVYFKNTLVPIGDIDATIFKIREMKDEIQHDQQLFLDYTNLAELELSLLKQLEILVSLFEREVGYLSLPESVIVSEASKIPTEAGVADQIPEKDEVRSLAESCGLFRNWRVNPHLTFEEGDITYFWERRFSRTRLEAQFRARRLVLEKAEEIDLVIPEPGDLSEMAKPIKLRLLAAWQLRLTQKPDANAAPKQSS